MPVTSLCTCTVLFPDNSTLTKRILAQPTTSPAKSVLEVALDYLLSLNPTAVGRSGSLDADMDLDGIVSTAPAWSSGTTYAIGDTVVYSSVVYVSKVNSNTNHQPDTSATQWTATLPLPKSLFTVTVKNTTTAQTQNVLANPRLQSGATVYAGGTTYALNDVVYYTDGKTYISLQASNTGHAPDVSPTWWQPSFRSAIGLAIEAEVAALSSSRGTNVLLVGDVDYDIRP